GTLVLSVHGDSVTYLGRVLMNDDEPSWSAGQTKAQLDVNSGDLGNVVLVDAWLSALDLNASCAEAPVAVFGLLERGNCGVTSSFLTDQPGDPEIHQDENYAPSAFEVQDGAYEDYASQVGSGASKAPVRAVYVISKRLFNYGCDRAPVP